MKNSTTKTHYMRAEKIKSSRHHSSNIVREFYFIRLEAMSTCDQAIVP